MNSADWASRYVYASAYCAGSPSAVVFTIGNFRLYFSFNTPVAFYHDSVGLVCRENDFSRTTGMHLNAIEPDKRKRVSGVEFCEALGHVLEMYGFTSSDLNGLDLVRAYNKRVGD